MNLKVGDSAALSKKITDADIRAFAKLSGDHNPLHLDEAYAKTTRFGHRIAHGMLGASLISAVLGNELPGKGAIYLSQSLQFLRPIYVDNIITARVTVQKVREDKSIVTVETTCENQQGETLIRGEAVLLVEGSAE